MKTLLSLTSRRFAMTRVRVVFQNIWVLSGGEVSEIGIKWGESQSWGIRKGLAALALAVLVWGVNAQESPKTPDAPDIRMVAIASPNTMNGQWPPISVSNLSTSIAWENNNSGNNIVKSVVSLWEYSELANLTYCASLLDWHKLDEYTGATKTLLEETANLYGIGEWKKPVIPEWASDIKISLIQLLSRLVNWWLLTPARRAILNSADLIPQVAYGWWTLGHTYQKSWIEYLKFKDFLVKLWVVEEENYEWLVGLFNQWVSQGETRALVDAFSIKDWIDPTVTAVNARLRQVRQQMYLVGDIIMYVTLWNTNWLARLKLSTNLDTLFSNPNDAGIKKIVSEIFEWTGVPLSRSLLDQVAAWSKNRLLMITSA